ncbi:MAG: T9SS type A sorting domain-containing protein [Reichenbachiella sp.]
MNFKWSKVFLLATAHLCSVLSLSAQETSILDGDWDVDATWTDGSEPGYTNLPDITINSYVISAAGLSFASANNLKLYVYDTLIVYGDVVFDDGKSNAELVLGDNSVLIIFGDLNLGKNHADAVVGNNAVLVVDGDITAAGTGADITGDGKVYTSGTTAGVTNTATGGEGVIDELDGDGFETIEEFVNGGGSSPLPVELTSFTASSSENGVLVFWETVVEIDNDFYTLERSYNGESFEIVEYIQGAGDSNESIFYQVRDYPASFGRIYYRLTQTDFDGTSEVFPIISMLHENPNGFSVSVYPTRITNETNNIRINNIWGDIQYYEVQIIDLKGQMTPVDVTFNANYLTITLHDAVFNPGIHILKGQINGMQISQKVIFGN